MTIWVVLTFWRGGEGDTESTVIGLFTSRRDAIAHAAAQREYTEVAPYEVGERYDRWSAPIAETVSDGYDYSPPAVGDSDAGRRMYGDGGE